MVSDIFVQRASHKTFFEERDWDNVSLFWRESLQSNNHSELFQQNHNNVNNDFEDASDQLNNDNHAVIDEGEDGEFENYESDIEKEVIYDVTDLQQIHQLGLQEYSCGDPRYKRQTFAMRIGYDGTQYHGYQRQLISKNSNIRIYEDVDSDDEDATIENNHNIFNSSDHLINNGDSQADEHCGTTMNTEHAATNTHNMISIPTVEDDIYAGLGGRSCVAAGRTDKKVHAISQIISFSTYDVVTPESLTQQLRDSSACRQGHLNVFECTRVPKRFNALFSATWRRYLFLFPLNAGTYPCSVLYNTNKRVSNNSSTDKNATNENFSDNENTSDVNNSNTNTSVVNVDVNVEFIHTALQQLVNKPLPYNAYAYREDRSRHHGDICTLYKAIAFIMHVPTSKTSSSSSSVSTAAIPLAMCVELVGDRFLRCMVRILVATAVRESICPSPLPQHHPQKRSTEDGVNNNKVCNDTNVVNSNSDNCDSSFMAKEVASSVNSKTTSSSSNNNNNNNNNNSSNSNINVLVDIALEGQRSRASVAVDGRGLCLAGVGYDMTDLAKNKISGKRSKKKAECVFGVFS